MKTIKVLTLLLVLSMALAVFAGCKQKAMEPAGTVSDLSEERHFGVDDILMNNGDSTGESASTPSGEFIVSEKKYTYQGQNLMLLHVKNDTDTHYDLTIHGQYLDAEGNTIKEDSQTYRAFPAGWENYFIFYPKMTFDGFTYSIEVNEFKVVTEIDQIYAHDGEPYSTYVEVEYEKKLEWRSWGTDRNFLQFDIQYTNHHPSVSLYSEWHVLILDEQGEIYAMNREIDIPNARGGTAADPIGGEHTGASSIDLKMATADEVGTIPDSIQGKFTVIFAFLCTGDDELQSRLFWEGKLSPDWRG